MLDDDDADLSKNDSIRFARELIYKEDYRSGFLHLGKKRNQILGGKNFINYTLILSLMFAWQFSFQYFKAIWSFAFYFFVVAFVFLALIVIVGEFKKVDKKEGFIIITHLLLGYFIFSCGKNVYVRSYGDETIGSCFEKSEYRTMYYVVLKSGDRELKLPAQIHVNNTIETEGSYDAVLSTETTISQKNRYIVLEKVLLNDGVILSFRDCELNRGRSTYCSDLIGREWEVELLNEKYIH